MLARWRYTCVRLSFTTKKNDMNKMNENDNIRLKRMISLIFLRKLVYTRNNKD